MRKSALKQKDYEIRLSEVDLKDKDCFSIEITRSQIRKRKDHLERILKPTDDVPMQETFSEQQIIKMAMPTIQHQVEPCLNLQVKTSDYSTIGKEKKVRINVVEKKVLEYHLDQEEIDYKQKKSGKRQK